MSAIVYAECKMCKFVWYVVVFCMYVSVSTGKHRERPFTLKDSPETEF